MSDHQASMLDAHMPALPIQGQSRQPSGSTPADPTGLQPHAVLDDIFNAVRVLLCIAQHHLHTLGYAMFNCSFLLQVGDYLYI